MRTKERDNWGLCARQREAVELLCAGVPVNEAAKVMGCEPVTVRSYVNQAKQLFGVQSMWGLKQKMKQEGV